MFIKRKNKPLSKKLSRLSALFLSFLLFFAALGLSFFAYISKGLPDPEQFASRQVIQSTKIYDRTGTVLLYEIHGEEKRTVIPFDQIPEIIKKATLTIEDKNFYNHPAFDWRGTLRAVYIDLKEGRLAQGGSTITQQLARNVFLSREKKIIRKIKELLVAIELEKNYTKDKILDLYLNQIPYGGNAYGIEAASQTYFKKSAKDLNIAESALLVSLPKAPSYYSPWGTHIEELMKRKNFVIDQLFADGIITAKEKDAAKKFALVFAPQAVGLKAPHFTMAVQDYLNKKYGEDFAETAGLTVITTLDWDLQQLAEKTVKEGAERNRDLYKGFNAALVAQDAATGQVLALTGSKDYFGTPEPEGCTPGVDCRFEGNFDVATQGLRQPGSAMKPFAYITAFQKGYSPDTVVFDVPTEFAAKNKNCPAYVDYNSKEENDKCFHPGNFSNIIHGPINLRNALAQSVNIAAVKTLYLAGIDETLKNAGNFGISTLTERSRYGLSLVLGGGEVTLLELTGAYSVFAQEGIKHQQTMILKITDSRENVLEEYKDSATQIIEPQYPRLINDVLSDVNARSPLYQNSLSLTIFPGHDVALKTGTTNDYHDAWAMGYTPNLVTGVWAGNNNNAAMERQGGSILAAIPMWNAFMKEALKTQPLATFNKPDPVMNTKSMLRGDYIVNFKVGDKILPQVHDILFYVNKNDPRGPIPKNPQSDSQFENWEYSTLEWAKNNIPYFETNYNQPLPEGIEDSPSVENSQPKIELMTPQNGNIIKSGETIIVQAKIDASISLEKIELYFNDSLIAFRNDNGKNIIFQYSFTPSSIQTQNSLKIKVIDSSQNKSEASIILFK
ncbi:MAG: transglycosylase domain-containing protein [Candidatus Pacebacteria bacterium]|nr:transglycosylase domain-containing protein [Candidatus Paceibacterota bacterium]